MIIAMQMLVFFRESVMAALDGWLPLFFTRFVRNINRNGLVAEEDEVEEQVYADFDDECGVIFFPPIHVQRYAAVCDCLMDERWFGKLDKVLNIEKHHDINFMKYLSEVPGVVQILGLNIESSLNCTCEMLDLLFDDYGQKWEKQLQLMLLQGNVADPDYRLIGCDAVIAIEIIQQLLPHDLDRLVHNVFGFIRPWVVVLTTPNADFNHFLKNLDKNGVRHSDHYFEWSRVQLHDWCSNIVQRYPDYTVVSRGVGPGPVGTSHYGCYSQLVLFISTHYKKEMELNVNSLVMVPDIPEPDEVSDMVWLADATVVTSTPSILHTLEEDTSIVDLHNSESIGGSSILTTTSSEDTLKCVDKSFQCNLDIELEKSFLMFDNEEMYQVLLPRNRVYSHVYEIGDVASRLNNTMSQVKQFSKKTQHLMEKNELGTSSTLDMMNEITQLTEKLIMNLDRGSGVESGDIWNNVNWGENVPYWNQYYKVLDVINYPYVRKSEDDMIMDLLSEEINRLLDERDTDTRQGGQFEIPVKRLMDAVKHITVDVIRVINLLEDHGYEVDGESVVYPIQDGSVAGQEDELESSTDVKYHIRVLPCFIGIVS